MTAGFTPEPEHGEAVIWRHASPMEAEFEVLQKFAKSPPAWFRTFGKLFHWLVIVAFWALMIINWNEQEDVSLLSTEFWIEWFQSTGWILLAALAFGWVFGFILKKRGAKPIIIDQASGIPVWMSARRLAFNPSLTAPTNALDIKAIQSISTDFIMGSPALLIRTSTDTFKLMSSETRNLLKHLYTLRPDLEPTP